MQVRMIAISLAAFLMVGVTNSALGQSLQPPPGALWGIYSPGYYSQVNTSGSTTSTNSANIIFDWLDGTQFPNGVTPNNIVLIAIDGDPNNPNSAYPTQGATVTTSAYYDNGGQLHHRLTLSGEYRVLYDANRNYGGPFRAGKMRAHVKAGSTFLYETYIDVYFYP